ncbi:hypothetical protein TrRE_jg4893 [Triparma retinervis]|uniref:C3H1-type domain-containing protein n=1 Tax=Triparma retinervis TaxID=2557542 RepID=A0A9W7L594_9STRA|nr:hypothetical protein TrRE_jg4893 [Triparma retinervis]
MPKRAFKPCPEGYVCNICKASGHWVFDCAQFVPQKKSRTRKKKVTDSHTFTPGVDPSPADIAKAKEMQKEMNVNIKAPKCFCGLDAKMRKCMTQDQTSKAFGVMFWWCNKDKWDEDGNEVERCKFARRVDQGRARVCTFWRETGSCKKGSECSFAHDIGGELTWKGKDGSHHSESKEKKEGVKGVGEEEEEEEKVVEKVEGVGVEVESEKDKGEVEESDSSSSSSSSSDSDSDSDSDDSSVLSSSSSSSSDEK